MVAYVFDSLLAQGVRKGQIPARTKAARDWFRGIAQQTSATQTSVFKTPDKSRITGSTNIGEMCMFKYDPKHKKTLPFYDTFPVIFPIDKAPGGFLGINMHYLPHTMRAKLMDALYGLATNKQYDETTKLKLSYSVLNAAATFKWFKPCVKHYLTGHVNSRFLNIASTEWDIAIFLPLESFQKSSTSGVWKESRRIINRK